MLSVDALCKDSVNLKEPEKKTKFTHFGNKYRGGHSIWMKQLKEGVR